MENCQRSTGRAGGSPAPILRASSNFSTMPPTRVRAIDGMSEHSGAAVATDGRRGTAAEVLLRFLAARADELWRPDRASRLFPRRVRRPPGMARRTRLCRPGGAVPVPARAGHQPGRLFHRSDPRRLSGRLAAWTGFTLPSAIAIVLFAYGAGVLTARSAPACCMGSSSSRSRSWRRRCWGMARTLWPDRERASIAVAAGAHSCSAPPRWRRSAPSCLAAVAGLLLCRGAPPAAIEPLADAGQPRRRAWRR